MKTTIRMTLFVLLPFLWAACGEKQADTDQNRTPETPAALPTVTLSSPEEGALLVLDEEGDVSFSWNTIEEEKSNTYRLLLSLSEDLSSSKSIVALKNPLKINGRTFDGYLADLGVKSEQKVTLYWAVEPWSAKAEKEVRSLTVTRLEALPESVGDADPIKIKVAVLFEDPEVPGTGGKRMHEVCKTPGYGFSWRNPYEQVKEMEKFMEMGTNNTVDFEVVKMVDCDQFFTYDTKKSLGGEKKYITMDTLINHILDPVTGRIPGLGEGLAYDYTGMMKHYGFDKMRNNDEIQEIWVFIHPACGMYETRLIGPGAFWCNSTGIDDGTTNKLVCVVNCNYEREIALALHSVGHRIESIMNRVYGSWNHNRASVSDMNSWDKFTAYADKWEKYEPGNCHIGLCHFPPNAHKDYEYNSTETVNSYCDDWLTYPNLPGKKTRPINREEWATPDPKNHPGDYQLGYMVWAMQHIPHFKGVNTQKGDMHLNNWWYYIVDYENALKEERRLGMEL